MKKEENTLAELIDLAQCQRALRDELCSRQDALAREVSASDIHGYSRTAHLASVVVTALLLVGPTTLVLACTSVPEGRDMRTALNRTHVIEEANQLIVKL